MRIGLSAYLLHGGQDYRAAGVHAYTYHLLSHLRNATARHEFLSFQSGSAPEVPGVAPVRAPVPTERALVRIAWEQTGFAFAARRHGVEVVHGTVNVVPLGFRGPTVVTVHDLSFLRIPNTFPAAKVLYLRTAVALSVRHADHVIAVSRSTLRDCVELLGVPEEKISVVYSGVSNRFVRLPPYVRDSFRESHFGGRPFILHVGTLQPRKNLPVLIRAFAAARRECNLPHVLALVGGRGWMYEEIMDLVRSERLGEHVVFVGFVSGEELPLWYNSADLFAYPSAYEGFGLPLLEAMACGTPVVTSDGSSLGEVVGDAGLTVPPDSQEALTMALMRVLGDESLRADLIARGQKRVLGFTWQRTAIETIRVYETVVGDSAH